MADRAKWSLLPVCSIVTNFAKIILRLNIFESGKKDISKMNMLSKTKNLKPTYAIKLILEIKINNFSLKAAGFVRPITGQWQTGSSQFCISSPSSWSSCTHSKNQICTDKRCMPPIQPPKMNLSKLMYGYTQNMRTNGIKPMWRCLLYNNCNSGDLAVVVGLLTTTCVNPTISGRSSMTHVP